MKKVSSAKKTPSRSKATKASVVSKVLKIRFPRFTFRGISANVFLVFSLVIFAFLLGMMTNKVLYLEKAAKMQAAPTVPVANQQLAAPSVPPPPDVVTVEVGKLPVLGDKNAKVTIVEFSDFQCPFCKRYVDETQQQLYDEYIKTGKANLYYRHFPLSSIHPNAQKAGEASECANEQGKFWDYSNILFRDQESWSPKTGADVAAAFTDFAGELGLDTTQFSSCLASGKYAQTVQTDATAGSIVRVEGTPTFFINGHRLVGAQPFEVFKSLIDAQLKN